MIPKTLLRIAIQATIVGAAASVSANQGVAVQNSGQTMIVWADDDGTVHVANAQNGQGVGTFSAWEPVAGIDTNDASTGAISPPAALAHHDASDSWDAMWQAQGDKLYYFNPSLNPALQQVKVNGTAVAACSAPTFTVAPSGTVYAAVAGCAGTWRTGPSGLRLFIPKYPLEIYALSNGTWSSMPAPSVLLAQGTAPAIFARTGGADAGEIDVAYQSTKQSLDYLFCPAGQNPAVASSWSAATSIAPTITSQPAIYVSPQNEADVIAQLPNNVLGIWYATPGSAWSQIPMPPGSATGAPSIGGGLYAADPVNAPQSRAQITMIASPENLEGLVLVGVGELVSSGGSFSFQMEGIPSSPVVLGIGVGGITPGTKNLAGQIDPWESNVTVMAIDPDDSQLGIGAIEKGAPTDVQNWTAGNAVFKNPYCAYPVTFQKSGSGARSGAVTVVPLYWGYNPSANEPNWPDFYNTLLGSSYFRWITEEYGLTTDVHAVAPMAYQANDPSVYSNSGTNCAASDEKCIVEANFRNAAVQEDLPMPGGYDNDLYIIHAKDTANWGCDSGFNSHFTWTDSANITHDLYYAVVTDGACNPDLVEGTVSHELLESLTDPGVSGGWSNGFTANDCSQIADLCQSEGFHIYSNATGINWGMDRMWSNAANSCLTTSGSYQIQVLSKCMDVPDWNTAPGTPVNIWDCNGGSNQQFNLNSDGTITPSFALDMCLELANGQTADGTGLQISPCNGATYQRWTRYGDGTIHGLDGKCLDNPDWQTANGTQFDYWDCNGGSNQSTWLQ
jgi:hypothetical protein